MRRDTQEMFQVVDFDEQSGTRRIQMFDGNLDELDDEAWRALSPHAVAPPEDWTAASGDFSAAILVALLRA